MAELTTEEREKIYLEEKTRIEAREKIEQEIKERRKEKPKLYKSGLLWFVVIVLIIAGMQKSREDSGSVIGGAGGLVLLGLLVGGIIDTIKAKITKREVVSQVNIKKWFWVNVVFLVIGLMVIIRTNESSNVSAVVSPQVSEEEAKVEAIDLIIISWNWRSKESGYAIAEGQVQNVSGQKLSNVQAVLELYDSNGDFISSGSALIEYDPLLPKQRSPFEVMVRYNPAMKGAQITFGVLGGRQLNSMEKNDYIALLDKELEKLNKIIEEVKIPKTVTVPSPYTPGYGAKSIWEEIKWK
ncbi:FxLYD domain-containing protein [Patescibacteria group bacterium]|nr:FxLYD domain-containing protein [Patescibacteria group bacterium]